MGLARFACSFVAMAAVVTPAAAQTRSDPYQHAAIAAGEYATAEKALRAEQRLYPDKPEVLVNLAAVLARTGRADAARSLYQRVLAGENVSLMRANGEPVGAHAVAQKGLALLNQAMPVGYAAR